MQPFLALITPVGVPDQPPAQPPLGIWGPGDPRPTNPIAGFNPGTGTWPTPPGGGGSPPLVIWGPGDPRPTLPIAGWDPGTGTFPQPPLGTWGGAGQPFPTNPIAEPPWGWGNKPPEITLPPEVPGLPGKVDWGYAWTPATGWVVIGTPAEGTLVPTPSRRAPKA